MSKAATMAKTSAKGGFHLLWGLVASTIILSVGTIFIARMLSSDLYGLYSIALITPTLMGTFRDWGINSAMIRYSAQCRAEGKPEEIRSILLSGVVFEIAIGLFLTATSLGLSSFLAINIFHRPELTHLLQIASISILASGLINAATATFVGIERMELNSVMLIFQAIIKTTAMIALVFLGFSTAGAIIGYTVGLLTAGIVGMLFIWTIYRQLPKKFPLNPK